MHEPGHIIGGRYRLEECIGSGGMAVVWRATHIQLTSPVAVKLLSADRGFSPSLAERFLNEARVAASIRHRNVVEIIDFGKTDEGQPYMVMELLEGGSLADRMKADPPLVVPELLRFISLSLQGLSAVHQAGIVHRDLKPENIFCVEDADGIFPKLLDFGVSRAVRPTSAAVRSAVPTENGVIVGTPQYMSPEQARGLTDIDLRTDIYSMSVILYEALTGQLPFDAPHVGDVLMNVMMGVAPPVASIRPELGQPLSDVIERGMARDRAARFQSAKELREALTAAMDRTSAVGTTWKRAPVPKLGASSIRPPRPELPQTRELVRAANARSPVPEVAVAAAVPDEPAVEAPPPAHRRHRPLAIGLVAVLAVGFSAAVLVRGKERAAAREAAHARPAASLRVNERAAAVRATTAPAPPEPTAEALEGAPAPETAESKPDASAAVEAPTQAEGSPKAGGARREPVTKRSNPLRSRRRRLLTKLDY